MEDVAVEPRPQLVRHAPAIPSRTVFAAPALRRVDRLVDGDDDVGHGEEFRCAPEVITTTRTADAVDQAAAAQLAERLLQIRQREFCRSEMAASIIGPRAPWSATSIIAVTANLPLVVRRIALSEQGNYLIPE